MSSPVTSIVITGSSSGIGRAIALAVARPGVQLVIHAAKNLTGATETQRLVTAAGATAHVTLADLRLPEQQDQLVNDAWNRCSRIDAWVNNAGVDTLTGPAATWSFEEKLRALLDVDLTATMRLTRAVGKRMQAAGTGAIVNIGWDQAATGMAGDSGELFAAVKGAIMAFTKSAAHSLAPQVRVNCVAPGWIKTAWGVQASAAWQQRATREALLQRWGTPEDIAGAVAYLISPAASFITGQILNVNGGFRGSFAE
jgi:3-oxoacyl-[acyl-carrier protein] reductase